MTTLTEEDVSPMRTRFVFIDGQPRAITNRVQKINGTHKGYRMLFGAEGLEDVIPDNDWKRMLLAGRVTPFPTDEKIEELSDRIGETPEHMEQPSPLTPQEALSRALAHMRYMSATDAGQAGARHD